MARRCRPSGRFATSKGEMSMTRATSFLSGLFPIGSFSPRRRGPRCGVRPVESLEGRTLFAAFGVNTLVDTGDVHPGDGLARDANGLTSLRAAVMEANALAGHDTVNLPAGTYALTRVGANENGAATGDLDILGALTLVGAGRDSTTTDGQGADRVVHIRG